MSELAKKNTVTQITIEIKQIDQLYVWTDFEGEYTVIKEIEVPDELVKEALAFVQMKNKFDGFKEKFEALLERN